MTIYHVTREWDGKPLKSLASKRRWTKRVGEMITDKWPDISDPWSYYHTEGQYVHCHATLQEAVDFRDEWCPGGVILEIEASGLKVGVGQEYPHPVVRGSIEKALVRPLAGPEA